MTSTFEFIDKIVCMTYVDVFLNNNDIILNKFCLRRDFTSRML